MTESKEMPFLDHLEELRWRILWSVLAIGIGAVLGIIATIRLDLMSILTAPLFRVLETLGPENPSFLGMLDSGRLVFLNLTEPFFFILNVGIMVGVVLASPAVVYQAWAFLAPALEKRERRAIVPTFVLGLGLFAAGASLAYFVALPMTIRFLLLFGAEWFTPALTAGYYLSLVTRLLMAFGLAFELPVVLLVLTALGLVSPAFLRTKRRHALVAVTVLAAMVSPGDAPQLTFLLMGPLFLLYEFGILLSAGIVKRRNPNSDELGAPDHSVSIFGVMALATYTFKKNRMVGRPKRAAGHVG
jgi:sec-independent protein translocase protein TatC